MSDAMTDGSSDPKPPAKPERPRNKSVLIAVVGLGVLWWGSLITLALTTANPVTLNQEQIHRSRYVVTATVDLDRGVLNVRREWKTDADDTELQVADDALNHCRPEVAYLIPLIRSGGGWKVTPSSLPNRMPLVYPATPDAERQLKTILKAGE